MRRGALLPQGGQKVVRDALSENSVQAVQRRYRAFLAQSSAATPSIQRWEFVGHLYCFAATVTNPRLEC